MRKLGIIMTVLVLLLITTACSNKVADKTNDHTLKVYTTIYPLEYFTKRIGGKYVDVSSIIPPGADAHTFEPTTKTMVKMAEADVFVYNKMKSDEFSSSVADTLKEQGVPLINGAKDIHYAHRNNEVDHNDEQGSVDPHIWLDPILAEQMADNIYNGLVKRMPKNKAYFKKNHDDLTKDLNQLDTAFKTKVKDAPKNTFIVSHAAYGYWADRYGLHQISISGLSPSHEPSQHQIQNIIETAKNQDVHYILFEKNVNNKIAAVVKKEVGAESLTLHNLETLTKKDIQEKKDYMSIMNQNIDALAKSLQ